MSNMNQNKGRQVSYSPWDYRCCQHNVAMIWPWLAENLWQASADGGLVAWIYSGCEVSAAVADGRTVRVREETDYPFSGEVKLSVACEGGAAFPLYLRVPGWCRDFRVEVNGRPADAEARPGHYLRVERAWATGDVVTIAMGMSLGLTTWPRTGSVTVDRGPLSYSLKIGERWQRCGGTDAWPEWELFPATPWNYGLVLDARDPAAREAKLVISGVGRRMANTPARELGSIISTANNALSLYRDPIVGEIEG